MLRPAAALISACLAMTAAHAVPMNVHVEGVVPLDGSANDFHMRIVINRAFLLGEPIDFINGAFSADGATSVTDTGFTVDWSGPTITDGGPYTFGFDMLINTDDYSITESWWTINGRPVRNVPPGLFTLTPTPVPEPPSAALLALAGLALWAHPRRPAVPRQR
jgi:hypothetical protein